MENYIVINGKKAELTKEQLEKLGIKINPKRNNPFDRVEFQKTYFTESLTDKILSCVELGREDSGANASYNCCKYFNDNKFAKQVFLRQLLYRKLLKYSWDNDAEDVKWECGHMAHYCISLRADSNKFCVCTAFVAKSLTEVYFSKKEVAEKAIEDVVEPFMKEHPDFEA